MTREELDKCLSHLDMDELYLAKLIGCKDMSKMTVDNDRCVRALVLHRDVRSLVSMWRSVFPNLEFVAIRAIRDDAS